MKTIETQAVIEGIRARKDGSLGLTVTTPELNVNEKAYFMELQNINIKLLITPTDEKKVEDYKVDAELNQKTPSQRIRNVLYILWKQNPDGKEFEDYYKMRTEKIIEYLKTQIENQ